MTDKKFTDEEIIKALREMADYPHNYEEGQQLKNALDLINRQKMAVETLKVELAAMRGAANSYKAENERLNKKVVELSEVLSDTIRIRYAEVKAEAYEEFAERLKEYAEECIKNGYDGIGKQDIDNLLKEMAGE